MKATHNKICQNTDSMISVVAMGLTTLLYKLKTNKCELMQTCAGDSILKENVKVISLKRRKLSLNKTYFFYNRLRDQYMIKTIYAIAVIFKETLASVVIVCC